MIHRVTLPNLKLEAEVSYKIMCTAKDWWLRIVIEVQVQNNFPFCKEILLSATSTVSVLVVKFHSSNNVSQCRLLCLHLCNYASSDS